MHHPVLERLPSLCSTGIWNKLFPWAPFNTDVCWTIFNVEQRRMYSLHFLYMWKIATNLHEIRTKCAFYEMRMLWFLSFDTTSTNTLYCFYMLFLCGSHGWNLLNILTAFSDRTQAEFERLHVNGKTCLDVIWQKQLTFSWSVWQINTNAPVLKMSVLAHSTPTKSLQPHYVYSSADVSKGTKINWTFKFSHLNMNAKIFWKTLNSKYNLGQ